MSKNRIEDRTVNGKTLGETLAAFDAVASDRDKIIAGMVETKDEDFEVDVALVSEGDDNGAYVMGWRWVSFAGTPLDKEPETK